MKELCQLRELAADLRRLAALEPDATTRAELLDLAERCDAMANQLEGNGAQNKS